MPHNCEAVAAAGGIGAIASAFSQHVALPRMQVVVISLLMKP